MKNGILVPALRVLLWPQCTLGWATVPRAGIVALGPLACVLRTLLRVAQGQPLERPSALTPPGR